MALVGGLGRARRDLQVSLRREERDAGDCSAADGADVNAANDADDKTAHAAAMVGATPSSWWIARQAGAKNSQGDAARR